MKRIIIALTLILTYGSVQSQCLTDKIYEDYRSSHTNSDTEVDQIYSSVPFSSQTKRATKYIIPVVFHVIHTNGAENISLDQIKDQIRILNEDFSYTNPNKSAIRSQFTGVAADCEIEFRLAKIDPQGNCTDGVNRVYSPLHIG